MLRLGEMILTKPKESVGMSRQVDPLAVAKLDEFTSEVGMIPLITITQGTDRRFHAGSSFSQ